MLTLPRVSLSNCFFSQDELSSQMHTGPWFNIKMSSYQYRKSLCGDKTVVRSSYLHNGISYTGKMTSLYWVRALTARSHHTTTSGIIRFARIMSIRTYIICPTAAPSRARPNQDSMQVNNRWKNNKNKTKQNITTTNSGSVTLYFRTMILWFSEA